MQLRRWAAIAVMGAALTTTVGVPGAAQAASGRSASPSFGVWRATVDDNGFITDFWWWPY
jgi:hypothetical protein